MEQEQLFEESSGNVFADLGIPDADNHLVKAKLVIQMMETIKSSRMTQGAVAKAVGTNQPEISRILRGQFRSVSVDRLMQMLTRLDCGVDIVVTPPGKPQGKIVAPAVIHFGEAVPV